MSQLNKLEEVATAFLASMLSNANEDNINADRAALLTSRAVTYAKRLLAECGARAANDYVGSR